MTRREPVQKRSRQRVEEILLAAADLLAKSGNTEALTTTSVAKRSGVPVATIYRYFTDRSAIIAALIDRETAELDREIEAELMKLDTITIEALLRTITSAHYRHFKAQRRSIVLWFGARQSSTVLEKIDHRYKAWGEQLVAGCRAAGMVIDEVPEWGGESLFWVSDRVFEFMFRVKRSRAEQNAILEEFIEMLARQLEKYATPMGIEGIPRDAFLAAAGTFIPGGPTDARIVAAAQSAVEAGAAPAVKS